MPACPVTHQICVIL